MKTESILHTKTAIPTVSIILPVWNAVEFLPERLRSIREQTLANFEVIVVDSHSTDGSWKLLQTTAAEDSRFLLFLRPRGLYAAWNFGLRQARGKFLYIATADDTMRRDCLEKMARVLEEHPECSVCDSALEWIDAAGQPMKKPERYVNDYPEDRFHFRNAPHDALFSLWGATVYASITQILFRRELLARCGMFREDLGNGADFEWGIRAGWFARTVYIPEKFSAWRVHDSQATRTGICGNAVPAFFDELVHLAEEGVHTLEMWEMLSGFAAWRLLKPMRFRQMLLHLTCGDGGKKIAAYFFRYPEELILYPILFCWKRLTGKRDLCRLRLEGPLRAASRLIRIPEPEKRLKTSQSEKD